MKANELRIGNYVNVPIEAQCPFRIDSFEYLSERFIKVAMEIQINGIEVHPLTWYGGDLQPIPLTDEWLINLGAFEFDNQFIFDRFRIKYRPDYKFYYVLCRETNAYITKVEFVHEWQNVVFALNNQELILKNK